MVKDNPCSFSQCGKFIPARWFHDEVFDEDSNGDDIRNEANPEPPPGCTKTLEGFIEEKNVKVNVTLDIQFKKCWKGAFSGLVR